MRNLLRRGLLVPLALVSIAGGALLSAPPAQAAKLDCTDNQICFWVNANYTGARWYAGGSWSPGDCFNLPPSINNKASSAFNRRAREISVFDGTNCRTLLGWIHVGDAYPSLSINDNITSIRFEAT
jgi:hypothetical protein